MGVLYSIIAISELDESDDLGLDLSDQCKSSSRKPTVAELKNLVNSLTFCEVEWFDDNNTLVASITELSVQDNSDRATMVIMNYQDEDKEDYYFEKGSMLLTIKLIKEIVNLCGSQIIYPDSGYLPLLVKQEDNSEEIYQKWQIENA